MELQHFKFGFCEGRKTGVSYKNLNVFAVDHSLPHTEMPSLVSWSPKAPFFNLKPCLFLKKKHLKVFSSTDMKVRTPCTAKKNKTKKTAPQESNAQ